jgi:hypothetical protein
MTNRDNDPGYRHRYRDPSVDDAVEVRPAASTEKSP